jgi:hypothetical protein
MNSLQIKIEIFRIKMYKTANMYGFTSKQAVECSQKLDQLLNLLKVEEKKLTK